MTVNLRNHVPLLIILLVAASIRLSAALVIESRLQRNPDQEFMIPGDANGYWELASRIANGQSYELYTPPRRVMRMPGFPLFLAAIMSVFGESIYAVRIALVLVGVGACAGVYVLGELLVDRLTGLVACSIASVSPLMVGLSVLVLSETLFALSILIAMVFSYRFLNVSNSNVIQQGENIESTKSPRTWYAVAAGISHAVATLIRPTWAPILPLLAIWSGFAAWRQKTSFLPAILAVVAFIGSMTPWVIRNAMVTEGHFVPTSLWAGPSLYDGLNPTATGASDMQFFEDDDLLKSMSEYEMDREYRRRAVDYATAHPGRVLQLAFIKLWRFWKPWPSIPSLSSGFPAFVIGGFECGLYLLTVIGVWCCRHKYSVLVATLGPVLFFSVVHSVFVGSLRYRIPAEYPMCILTAVGLLAIVNVVRSRSRIGEVASS
ncbi:ArnT family glycosyltransferase [Calycomorphotria hydatis]|uniref:Glycosyltransferase RgtA/B/C/D-like domain-containing protein n=1 Tax=Calycomorphotria hydatis TaxID=2528027 RepID=A0A517T9J2_9PLAN|nr:glycosyltransferase family 39 protein [Calycomorphotria hydatis]QDT65042.1 hypothetical protein V22_22880 [Calycomorphotria hydatis]